MQIALIGCGGRGTGEISAGFRGGSVGAATGRSGRAATGAGVGAGVGFAAGAIHCGFIEV